MDKKTYSIGILCVTAVILLVANLYLPSNSATAEESITNDDMAAVTARTTKGGDALWVLDRSSGKLAVYVVEKGKLQLRDVQEVGEAFRKGADD